MLLVCRSVKSPILNDACNREVELFFVVVVVLVLLLVVVVVLVLSVSKCEFQVSCQLWSMVVAC